MIMDIKLLTLGILMTTLPSSINCVSQVTVYPPGEHIAYVRGEATFNCLSNTPGVVNITWLVKLENGTLLDYLNRDDIVAEFSSIGGGLGSLTFTYLLTAYNMSRIKCEAHYNSGTPTVRSVEATLLLVQGALPAVGSFTSTEQNSTFFLNWTPPHSLDIRDVDPDIEGYCIDIENSTSSLRIHTECNITVPQFTYPHPARGWCDTFVFTVTPVNVVGNGTQIAVPHYHQPGVCTGSLNFTDIHTKEVIPMGDVTVAENNITFSTERLRANRLYNVTVKATNNRGLTISSFILSTHDIVNATATERYINTVYSEHSDASGALFSFVFVTDSGDVNFSRSSLLPLDRNTSHNHTLPFDLYPGRPNRVYVYDIEHDGTLSNGVGYPAVSIVSQDTQGSFLQQEPSYLLACRTNNLSSVITVECTLNDTVATGFQVVTGFQVIVQSSNLSEVHKLHVIQSTDLQTPVTVPVERAGEYQVSIFAIREGTGILEYISSEQVMVSDAPTIATGDITTVKQPGVTSSGDLSAAGIIAVVIAGFILGVVLIIIISIVVIVCCCYRSASCRKTLKDDPERGCRLRRVGSANSVKSEDTVIEPLLQRSGTKENELVEPDVKQQPKLEPDMEKEPEPEVFGTHEWQRLSHVIADVAEDSNEAGNSELVMPREKKLSTAGVPESKPGATISDKDHVEQEMWPKVSAETTHTDEEGPGNADVSLTAKTAGESEHNNYSKAVEDSGENNEKPIIAGIVVPTKQDNYKLVALGLDDSTKKGEEVDVGQVGRSTEASQETNHRYSQPQTQLTRYPDGEGHTQSQNPGEEEQNVAFRAQGSNPDESLQLEGEIVPEDEKGDEGVCNN